MSKSFPKFTVYASLFLIPLFTLPFTSNILDFPKQFLLLILAGTGFVFWFWGAIGEKKLEINLNPLNLLPLALVALVLVASVFSLYRYGSFWGWSLPVAESFAATISLGMLYFLVVNTFKKSELANLAAVLGISAALAAIYAVLQSMGIYLLGFLPYAQNPLFNTIGTTGAFLVFAAVVLAMIFPLAFAGKGKLVWPMRICAAILLSALVFFNGVATIYFPLKSGSAGYDFSMAPWIILAVSAFSTLIFAASNKSFAQKNQIAKNASFALFFCAALFIVFNAFAKPIVSQISENFRNAAKIQTAVEISLRHSVSAGIAVEVLKHSPREFFIGSGPGTFGYDYVKFKPKQISQDGVGWNLTFFSASSEFINRAATTGALGAVLLLIVVLVWIAEGFRALIGEKEQIALPLAMFGGWLGIAVAVFYYPFNLSIALLFWFLLAAIVALDQEKTVSLALDNVKKNYAASLIFAGSLMAIIGLMVWGARHYYAETAYLDAVEAFGKKDIPTAIKKLEAAADATDRLQDNYLTGLAQAYLAQAEEEIKKGEEKDPQAALESAAPYLRDAIKNAVQSTEIANPNNASNWAFRAYVYRKLIGVSEGFDDWALDMYQNAIKLEPSNPSLFNEVGQIYLIKNDLNRAKTAFEKAVELMPQYIDARYYLALIADAQGEKEKAIEQLIIVGQLLPADDSASKENIEKAIANLRQGGSLGGQPAAQSSPAVSEESALPEGENAAGDSSPAPEGAAADGVAVPQGENLPESSQPE